MVSFSLYIVISIINSDISIAYGSEFSLNNVLLLTRNFEDVNYNVQTDTF